jgi:hypothetical protein
VAAIMLVPKKDGVSTIGDYGGNYAKKTKIGDACLFFFHLIFRFGLVNLEGKDFVMWTISM